MGILFAATDVTNLEDKILFTNASYYTISCNTSFFIFNNVKFWF